jgi:hypothetical protein
VGLVLEALVLVDLEELELQVKEVTEELLALLTMAVLAVEEQLA